MIELCVSMYGVDETRAIYREAEDRVAQSGLDGAFLRDWLIHIKQVAVERNPNTKHVWDQINVEKSNARPN